jgi:hypothetical protein
VKVRHHPVDQAELVARVDERARLTRGGLHSAFGVDVE